MTADRHFTTKSPLFGVALMSMLLGASAIAQVPVDENGNPIGGTIEPLENGVTVENPTLDSSEPLPAAELETLVGPIALYPDDLLAIVLPASTYPLEIVQAARFLDAAERDSSLQPNEDWDDSIVALLNYPDVLRMMNEDIDWTWRLGEAVVAQQPEVITAIESFRDRAYAAGNLKSDEHQTVTVDDGVIEIEPVADDVIYVPYYEPEQVVVVSPRPVYHYYPDPYPVYYYPYARRHYYHSRPFWGVTTAFTIGWATDRLHVYHPSYNGHPYFGHTYYGSFWRRPSINIYNSYYVDRYRYRPRHRYTGDYWRPRHRAGARPGKRTVRNYYSGTGNDRRAGRSDTRVYRESRNQRFSDTIRNATRPGVNRDVRQNRRAANTNRTRNTQRDRNQRPRQQQNRRASVDRDAIQFRARGDGRYTATRSDRARRAETRRENDRVRRQVQSNNRAANGARTTTPRVQRQTAERRGFATNRRAANVRQTRPAARNNARNQRQAVRQAAPVRQRATAPRVRSAQRAQPVAKPARSVKRSEGRRTSARRESRRSGGDRRPR